MASINEKPGDASNSQDASILASLLAEDYQSTKPLLAGRAFAGPVQVLTNWSSVFKRVPNFGVELLSSASSGVTEWGEWEWRGRHTHGSRLAMRGVTLLVVRDGLIAKPRLYMEPVDVGGQDIDEACPAVVQAVGPLIARGYRE